MTLLTTRGIHNMNFNYTLTSEECLEFIKESLPKTKYFLIELIAHIVTFLLLLLLSYTLFKERLLSFSIIAIFIFIVILFLKKNCYKLSLQKI